MNNPKGAYHATLRNACFDCPDVIFPDSRQGGYCPAQPPGSNPQPGNETTQVHMQAESVLIDVQATAPSKSLGQA